MAAALVGAVGLLSACTSAGGTQLPSVGLSERTSPQQHPITARMEPEVALSAAEGRRSRGVVARGGADAPYNYGPTVMLDGSRKRMWWCSQYGKARPAGDDILYGSARTMAGPFRAGKRIPRAVLSGSRRGFDGIHTCDPSVIRVGGTYYLYYTGSRGDHDFGNAIGIATSKDGVRWHRANEGRPIVTAAHDVRRDNAYGAGQPAAVYLDGWFYLMFTDTTGRAAGWNGAGQFLLRSPHPAFRHGVQSLGADGFTMVRDTSRPRTSSLADAFSADLMWIDILDAFAVAHQTEHGTTLTFWDRRFTVNPYPPVVVRGPWREGPGLLRTPTGHAPVLRTDPCGTVPIDLVRATLNARAPTNLRHYGLDLRGAAGCAKPAGAKRLLDGYAMPAPGGAVDVVISGAVVRVERRSVAAALADVLLDRPPRHLSDLPVVGRLERGAPVLVSPGNGPGVLVGDTLLPLRNDRVMRMLTRLNGSEARTISDRRWQAYPAGPRFG